MPTFAIQDVDFIEVVGATNINGVAIKNFAISVDFAKRLAMMTRTAKGEEVRNYFIECEKKLKSFSEALRLAADRQDQLALTSEKLEVKTIQLVESKEWLSMQITAKQTPTTYRYGLKICWHLKRCYN